MKVAELFSCPKPTGTSCDWGEEVDLSVWDAACVHEAGVLKAWYWYVCGGYEGTGYMLCLTDSGRWGVHYMGHCSCCGPTEDVWDSLRTTHESLEALEEYCATDQLRHEISALIEAARASQKN